MYTLPCVQQIASVKLLVQCRELSSVRCDGLQGGMQVGEKEGQVGGDICTLQLINFVVAETNATL